MHDGASVELVAGDVFEVPPGHDAWVIGDEPWISVDDAGRRLFAMRFHEYADGVLSGTSAKLLPDLLPARLHQAARGRIDGFVEVAKA